LKLKIDEKLITYDRKGRFDRICCYFREVKNIYVISGKYLFIYVYMYLYINLSDLKLEK